jgi:hypothetical protein
MSPTLNVLYGLLAGTISLVTLAVSACLVAASRADEQASRIPVPIKRRTRRAGRPSGAQDSMRN